MDYDKYYNRRLGDYIDLLSDKNSEFCESIRRYALDSNVPVVKRCTELFLKNILYIKRPLKILEIGTGIGYSAVMMAETLESMGIIKKCDDSVCDLMRDIPEKDIFMTKDLEDDFLSVSKRAITTIEKYEKRIPYAEKNIKESGFAGSINFICADAGKALLQLKEHGVKYDFIFMDGAKAQYINWLEQSIDLLNTGGIIFADNVLWEGIIIESRFAVKRRDRCIHSRLRQYLYAITHDKRLKSSIIPVGDGVALSVYNGADV